ncbi:MAG: hypothetical protein HY961_21830 [Ignavibacteriae bacterium]|nr:hypothetical protein [Ignavibacteriota bacterium]
MKKLHSSWTQTVSCGFAVLVVAVLLQSSGFAQNYGQQIAVMKMMNPNLKSVGVFGSALTDKNVQDLTRAGLGQGVQIVIGRPKDAREISSIYKKMVSEKSIQLIWIPDASDQLMVGVGFEFLRSNALPDKIGLIVPNTSMLASGALCTVQLEGGKLTAYVNSQVAGLLGANTPSDPASGIAFVAK